MTQQINLYDEALRPRREGWRAVHGLWVVGATLIAGWGLGQALELVSARRLAEARLLEERVAAERRAVGTDAGAATTANPAQAELERLRALDAAHQRVQAALQTQPSRDVPGYTPYLLALSRQTHPALWITGFSVGPEGDALEIQGRMTDASVLPGYLRRLNGEAQFKGRSFAQLDLKTTAPRPGEAEVGYTEFALRTHAGPREAGR